MYIYLVVVILPIERIFYLYTYDYCIFYHPEYAYNFFHPSYYYITAVKRTYTRTQECAAVCRGVVIARLYYYILLLL